MVKGDLKVILTVHGISPEQGGLARSIPSLAVALAQAGISVEIVTCQASSLQDSPMAPPERLVRTHLLPPSCMKSGWLARGNGFSKRMREVCSAPGHCVSHDNGLWLPNNHAVSFSARKLNIPLIISPRGMLTNWALRHKRWKKSIAWCLYQKRDLQQARVLHATSSNEARELRGLGLRQPIALIPNGVDVPECHHSPSRNGRLRKALFVGRIYPVKGLLLLVRAWANVRPPRWKMIVAGGDEAGHRAEVQAAVCEHNLQPFFEFIGPVDGTAKWDLYRGSDLFILPSYSENFGLVVAEALACGIPVLTTKGTPWEDLVTHNCGWWVEADVSSLSASLNDACSRTEAERSEMGARGKRLVERKFAWPGLAEQMISVYLWMLGKGDKPSCVVL